VEFKISGTELDFIVGKTSVTMLDDIPLIEIHYNISGQLLKFIKRLFDWNVYFDFHLSFYIFLYKAC